MSRIPKKKNLVHTRLANTYGGWIYCEKCGENIGYLCYVTYDDLLFKYDCKCGNHGEVNITFDDNEDITISKHKLTTIKNRLCCPNEQSPLLSVLSKKLNSYSYEINCIKCNTKYKEEYENE